MEHSGNILFYTTPANEVKIDAIIALGYSINFKAVMEKLQKSQR